MLSGVQRFAGAGRRAVRPAAMVGAGYAACWVHNREENPQQLLVVAGAQVWRSFARGLRLLGTALPEDAVWLREKLSAVESKELLRLRQLTESSKEQGLDTALLHRFFLQALCDCAKEEPSSLAAQGLHDVSGEAISDSNLAAQALALQIDATATTLAPVGGSSAIGSVLLPLSQALDRLLEDPNLGADGIAAVSHAATIATASFAQLLRTKAVSAAGITDGDEEAIEHSLASVWKALGTGDVRVRGRSAEAQSLHRDSESRLKALKAVPRSETKQAAEDFLPHHIRKRMADAFRGASAPSVPLPTLEQVAPEGSKARFAWKSTEAIAWLLLAALIVVAASQDGFKLLSFHVLPVRFRELLQKQAVQMEELMDKYETPTEMSDSIILGPWGAQSNYIQATPPRL